MLRVKRTTYGLPPFKSDEIAKLKGEIKNAITQLVNENKKIGKNRDDYVKIIHQIKKEYQTASAEKERLKALFEKYEKEKQRAIYWQNYPARRKKRQLAYESSSHDYDDDDNELDNEYITLKQIKRRRYKKVTYNLSAKANDNDDNYDDFIDSNDYDNEDDDDDDRNSDDNYGEIVDDSNNSNVFNPICPGVFLSDHAPEGGHIVPPLHKS